MSANLCDSPPESVCRIRQAEGREAMSTRTFEREAVSMTPDGHVRYVQTRAVNRHETVDLPFQRFIEKRLHAPQVAKTFFADVRDKRHGAWCLNAGVVQRPND